MTVRIKFVFEERKNGVCTQRVTRYRTYVGDKEADVRNSIYEDVENMRKTGWFVISSELVYDPNPYE